MPYYKITIVETTRHEIMVKARNQAQVDALQPDDFADECADNSGFVAVTDRDIGSIERVAKPLQYTDLSEDGD